MIDTTQTPLSVYKMKRPLLRRTFHFSLAGVEKLTARKQSRFFLQFVMVAIAGILLVSLCTFANHRVDDFRAGVTMAIIILVFALPVIFLGYTWPLESIYFSDTVASETAWSLVPKRRAYNPFDIRHEIKGLNVGKYTIEKSQLLAALSSYYEVKNETGTIELKVTAGTGGMFGIPMLNVVGQNLLSGFSYNIVDAQKNVIAVLRSNAALGDERSLEIWNGKADFRLLASLATIIALNEKRGGGNGTFRPPTARNNGLFPDL